MVYAGNSLQMNNEAFKSELTKWMRYNKKHQNNTRDGLSYATFGAPKCSSILGKVYHVKGYQRENAE